MREAIVALWREDQAKAARLAAGPGGWHRAAREEGTGEALWRSSSWRDALGMAQRGALAARRVGRGDQR